MSDNIILCEKFVSLLKEEKALSLSSGPFGTLRLTDNGIEFLIDKVTTALSTNYYVKPDGNGIYIHYSDISRVEVGCFKNLFTKIYTLRVYTKDASVFRFLMSSLMIVDKWIDEINVRCN